MIGYALFIIVLVVIAIGIAIPIARLITKALFKFYIRYFTWFFAGRKKWGRIVGTIRTANTLPAIGIISAILAFVIMWWLLKAFSYFYLLFTP